MESDDIFKFHYKNNEIKMYLPYETDYIMSFIKKYSKFWERGQLDFVSKFINNDTRILDCGAYIGNHSIYFSKISNAKEIIAIEPQKNIYDIMCENIQLNKIVNVKCINSGLNSKKENGLHILKQSPKNYGATRYQEGNNDEDIQCQTLDEFDDIDFLKIDCEGMSYEILNGGRSFFQKNSPVIWMEMNPEYDDCRHEFVLPLNFLMDYGYKLEHKLSAYDFIFIK